MLKILLLCLVLFLNNHILGQQFQQGFTGQNAILYCEVPDPQPNDIYEWIFNENQHIAAQQRFKIMNLTENETGTYECVVTRRVNDITKTARAAVNLKVVKPQREETNTVPEGENVRLKCSISKDTEGEGPYFVWFGPDGDKLSTKSEYLIPNIRLDQAGKYVCQILRIQDGVKKYAAQATNIQVTPTGMIKFPDLERNTKEVIETGYVYQKCQVNAELSNAQYDYEWWDPSGRKVSDNSILQIDYALKDRDAGTYECVAKPREEGLSEIKGKLHLVVTPLRFDVNTLSENNRVGGYSHKQISVSSLPMPQSSTRERFEFHWYGPNGEKLNDYPTDNFRIQLNDINDFGLYTIKVKGQYSDYETELKTQVLYNANIDPTTVSNIVITAVPNNPRIGGSLELTCTLDPPPSTISQVRWIKGNGQLISQGERLYFPDLQVKDTNDLYCEIISEGIKYTGAVNFNYESSSIPSVKGKDYNLKVYIVPYHYGFGDRVKLKCDAVPYAPQAVYEWYKDGRVIHRGPEYVIDSFSNNDIGMYRCQGVIDGSQFNSGTTLDPSESNRLVVEPYPLEVTPRTPFEFRCRSSTGNPPNLFDDQNRPLELNPKFKVTKYENIAMARANYGLTENELQRPIYCRSPDRSSEVTVNFVSRTPCSHSQGYCGSGECLPLDVFCNGVSDCNDSSDEDSITCQNQVIKIIPDPLVAKPRTPFTFTCQVPEGQKALVTDDRNLKLSDSIKFRVNYPRENIAQVTAVDGLEEIDNNMVIKCKSLQTGQETRITIRIEIHCPESNCQCRQSSCLPMSKFCDGIRDCPDGSDELETFCRNKTKIVRIWPKEIDYEIGHSINVTCETTDGSGRVPMMRLASGIPLEQIPGLQVMRTANNKITAFSTSGIDQRYLPMKIECYVDNTPVDTSTIKINVKTCDAKYENSCRDGTCLANSEFCNGRRDCSDGSDEENCTPRWKEYSKRIDQGQEFTMECVAPGYHPYPPRLRDAHTKADLTQDSRFTIREVGNRIFISAPNGIEKDLSIDCYLGGTPYETMAKITVITRPCEYRTCDNGRVCIAYSMICNSIRECSDGSDEMNCYPEWEDPPKEVSSGGELTLKCNAPEGYMFPAKVRDATTKQDLSLDPRFSVSHYGRTTIVNMPKGTKENLLIECYLENSNYNSVLKFELMQPKCEYTSCDYGQVCIDPSMICNGRRECRDGSDEFNCKPSWKDPIKNVYQRQQFTIQCSAPSTSREPPRLRNSRTLVDLEQDGRFRIQRYGNTVMAIAENGIDSDLSIDCYVNPDRDISVLIITVLRNPCPEQSCDNGDRCIDSSMICNGNIDCRDGSDERNCLPILTWYKFPQRADSDDPFEISCKSENRQNPKLRDAQTKRDLAYDDRFQVTSSTNMVTAYATRGLESSINIECYIQETVISRYLTILPKVCQPNTHHSCDNGRKCIENQNICNGISECQDGSDEYGCWPKWTKKLDRVNQGENIHVECEVNNNFPYPPKVRDSRSKQDLEHDPRFVIRRYGNKIAVMAPQGLSESISIDCYTNDKDATQLFINVVRKPCYPPNFSCDNGKQCFDGSKKCDGRRDCSDGYDEINCLPSRVRFTEHHHLAEPKNTNLTVVCVAEGKRGVRPALRYAETKEPLESSTWYITQPNEKTIQAVAYRGLDLTRKSFQIECYIEDEPEVYDRTTIHVACSPSERVCEDLSKCISREMWCNGNLDCHDGSDERMCSQSYFENKTINIDDRTKVTVLCTAHPLKPLLRYHDSKKPLGYDGKWTITYEGNQVKAISNGFLSADESPIQIDCYVEGSTQYGLTTINVEPTRCDSGYKICRTNKNCLPESYFCNGRNECGDNSDEENCSPSNVRFVDKNVEIPDGGRGRIECISDGNYPPKLRLGHTRLPLDEREFSVTTQGNRIIAYIENPSHDYIIECYNDAGKTDTATITTTKRMCRFDEFRCKNGNCISLDKKCDKHFDCTDGSDEESLICPTDEETTFRRIFIELYPDETLKFSCTNRKEFQDVSFYDGRVIDDFNKDWSIQRRIENGNFITDAVFTGILRPGEKKILQCFKTDSVSQIFEFTIKCYRDQFTCGDDKCINKDQICDGTVDCSQGEDEASCENPPMEVRVTVSPRIIRIMPNKPFSVICTSDKPDTASKLMFKLVGYDLAKEATTRIVSDNMIEVTFPNGLSKQFANVDLQCSYTEHGHKDKAKIVIQSPCAMNEKACNSGECIHQARFCDGKKDCADGSDEHREVCEDTCQPLHSKCETVNGIESVTKSITVRWICDGENDCSNGFDEKSCSDFERIPGKPECGGTHFTCKGDQKKIPFSYLCDRNADCNDSSDEFGCDPPSIISTNPPTEMTVRVGDTVTLSCDVSGTPLPTVIWRYNWGCLPNKDRATSFTEDSNNGCRGFRSVLRIENAQPLDAGLYNCEAVTLDHRAMSKEMQLFVLP